MLIGDKLSKEERLQAMRVCFDSWRWVLKRTIVLKIFLRKVVMFVGKRVMPFNKKGMEKTVSSFMEIYYSSFLLWPTIEDLMVYS